MANIILNGVGKTYPSGTVALYNASLTANQNGLLAVVGSEASGKSTLLRVIAGLEDASEGEIFIDNKNVTEVDVKNRNVAMFFQSNTLNPQISVFDNLAYGLVKRNANSALIQRRVKAVASLFNLTEVLNKKLKTVSTEQKQMIALGRAIVREPEAYLFDEPFAGLSQELKARMISVVAGLQARLGGAFVYATSNVLEAMSIATKIVVLKDGFIQQIDTPENLYDYPANEYVAFYIGSPTINFIRNASIISNEEGAFATFEGGKIALSQKVENRINKEYINSGKKVVLGIRPEDISVCKDGALTVKVSSVEKDVCECELGKTAITLIGDCQKGEEVKVSVNGDKVLIFDAETTLSVLSRDEEYQNTGDNDAKFIPLSKAEEIAIKNKLKPSQEKKKGKK